MVDGARLVERAERRRRLDLGATTCEQVQIIRWRLAGGAVDATVLAEVRLGDRPVRPGAPSPSGAGLLS